MATRNMFVMFLVFISLTAGFVPPSSAPAGRHLITEGTFTRCSMWGNKKQPQKQASAPASEAAFGSSKPKGNAKVGSNQSSTVKDSVDPNDPLYKARRVTRFMMFPWIFNGWDDTEERMKKTIKIESKMSAARRQALYDRNPEMYE